MGNSKKKFAANCMSVENRRRNVVGNYSICVFVAILLWLIPTAVRNGIKSTFERVQSPIYVAVANLEKLKVALRGGLLSKRTLITFCEDLLRRNSFLELELAAMRGDRRGDTSQSWDIETNRIGNFTLQRARVVRRDIASWTNELVIDAGAQHGIACGMGVIAKNHAIGRIKSVRPKAAIVELITSPQFRMVVRASEDATMSPITFAGSGRSTFDRAIGKASNVPIDLAQSGEVVTLATSELAGIFPGGIFVGTIASPDATNANRFSATVNLDNALLSKLYEVCILCPIGE
jgi:hypothetical protein